MEIKCTQEIKEAYNKLFKLTCSETRDTSYWRKASFNEVCSENLKSSTNNSTQCLAVDNLFTFNEALPAFSEFWCTPLTDKSETSLSFVATFEAVVTDAVASFKFIIGKLKDGKSYINEKVFEVGQDVHHRSGRYSKPFFRFGKGGVISHESTTRRKSLFLKA